jgi:hypothetical protein
MNKKISLLLLIFIASFARAQPLSKSDISSLQNRRHIEHILYEQYLQSDKGPVSVLGYHFDSFINDNLYFATAIFGAIEGDRGGYGIAAFGFGYRRQLLPGLIFDGKILIGSGGGGGVAAGGGLAHEWQCGLSYQFAKNIFLGLKYGYLKFPTGTYESPIFNAGISYEYNSVFLPFN